MIKPRSVIVPPPDRLSATGGRLRRNFSLHGLCKTTLEKSKGYFKIPRVTVAGISRQNVFAFSGLPLDSSGLRVSSMRFDQKSLLVTSWPRTMSAYIRPLFHGPHQLSILVSTTKDKKMSTLNFLTQKGRTYE